MPEFLVSIESTEVHTYRVEADDPAEAAKLGREFHNEGYEPERTESAITGLDNVVDIREAK